MGKDIIKPIVNSRVFSVPMLLEALYFTTIFVVSLFLWLPIGAVFVLFLVLILPDSTLLDSLDDLAYGQYIMPVVFALIQISIQGTVYTFILKRLEALRDRKLPKFVLYILIYTTLTISYLYLLYEIRDWWFIN
jgi:hypothetical protein